MTGGFDFGFGFDDIEDSLFGDDEQRGVSDTATEQAIVSDGITSGQSDPGDLTNLVFFHRHPERNGARIDRDEPDFEALRDEWFRIREGLVEPLLARAERDARVDRDAEGAATGALPSGVSTVALAVSRQWTGPRRPEGWQRSVYGLVVHQMGGALPCTAVSAGRDPVQQAVDHYFGSHGTHYVCGWGGIEEGELLQLADEHLQANGVGMSAQRAAVAAGTWAEDLPAVLVRTWRERWPGESDPMSLLPGTQTANAPYVHLEMVAAVVPWCNDGQGLPGEVPPPMREGLRYTRQQHDAVAELALDIARRHRWPDRWWTTSRLVGHEDLAPINRHDKAGGWDPGALRVRPWFDWGYVRERIVELQSG